MVLRTTTPLAGAVPCWCVRGARGRSGGRGQCRLSSPLPPPSPSLPCAPRGACGRLPRLGVPFPRLLVRHSKWPMHLASSVRLPFWCVPRDRGVFVRSRSCGVRAPPPLRLSCAHFARSPRRALVGPIQVVRAPPRFLLGSLAPPVLAWGGGVAPSPRLPS